MTTEAKNYHALETGELRYDYVGAIMAYESGKLGSEDTTELFQYLVDTGLAWQLQGLYGRTAMQLIQDGFIHPPTTHLRTKRI